MIWLPNTMSKLDLKRFTDIKQKPNLELRASLYQPKFFSFCLLNILTLTPWCDWTDRQTDKRQGSDGQTSQKEEIIWINKQTREKEKDQSYRQEREMRQTDK